MTSIETAYTRPLSQRAEQDRAFRIVVATAGDADSVGALWMASKLASHRSASVLALGVSTPFPHAMTPMLNASSPASIDEGGRLDMLADVGTALAEVPGTALWNKRAMVGWPADVIDSTATSWNASLIVIGLGRHGRKERLFGTETAVAVLKHARVPVLAVSAQARELPRRVCAAIDFTPASLSAATLAASMVPMDGTVFLVHACAFKGVKNQPGDLVDLYRTGARSKLDAAVAAIRKHVRCRVEGTMIDGEPSESILGYAQRKRCDLIALGGHEQGLMDRILLGSVRTRVLRGANCSVLIAPPDAKEG
jgi:nucleotide-binding universal stress UspA family protein